ncbi:DUF2231 domain-containing protein [Ancylobacter sp. IITR112]|uniref:DUF2231 domain-containing protein n=1 Tax=Ancylobacter sp. IITR112 TaxID=3138073 RepID=UPI00352ADD15
MAVIEAPAARILAPPLHPFLMLIPATCLTTGLLTDLAYWATVNTMWADFSAWLVSAGAILAWLVAIAGLVELLMRPALRLRAGMPAYVLAYLAAMVLATFNMLVHTRDAWSSVVPWGLALSALTVLAFLAAAAAAYVLVAHPRSGGAPR